MRVQKSAHLASKVPHGVGVGAMQISKLDVPRSRGQLAKLPYIILDNHISRSEALHLLGRIVGNVRRPLECYVPSGTSVNTSPHALHTDSTTESNISGSDLNSALGITAQSTYPNSDPALFVLPSLPLSIAESTSATLSEKSNYSSQTQSLLSSLLGVSFSLKRAACKTFTLKAKVLRVLSLNQHSAVFSKLMGLYGEEIKVALKKAGGTMFFVVGVKICTDATVETCEEGQRSAAGNVVVNASQVAGLGAGLGTQGTAGVELGHILSGRGVQKKTESVTTGDIKGERAFAIEYCCVQLRRTFDLVSRRVKESERLSDPESPDIVPYSYHRPLPPPTADLIIDDIPSPRYSPDQSTDNSQTPPSEPGHSMGWPACEEAFDNASSDSQAEYDYMSEDWETEEEEAAEEETNFCFVDEDGYEFEVVLDDKLYVEAFDCLG